MKAVLAVLFAFFVVTPLLFAFVKAEENADGDLELDLKAEKKALQTDDNVIAREEEQMSDDGFSVAEKKLLGDSEKKYEFQAEINRLMSLIVNSMYSNRDVFLRELISNGSDALDKIRYLSLTDRAQLGEGDQARLEIRIKIDPVKKMLHIRDSGVGMTKDDLIANLGRIAKSGTKDWIDKISKSENANQIGQFGVGFYSAFLVADTVTVTTKHNDDKQYIWESNADAATSYTVSEDPRGNTIGRGTLVTLHLKEDAEEFLDQDKLKALIQKYSEFINFPIYLHTKKTVNKEVPVEEEEETTEEAPVEDAEVAVEEDEEEAKDTKPKTKTVSETVFDWELVNETKPIWTRSPKEVSEEDYAKFYKTFSKEESGEALTHSHFTAEGDVDFTALLYVPTTAPFGMFEGRMNVASRVRLYVRRVFITDKFEDLIPKYLAFLTGVVDSDDLPLNVSREMLQQHKMLKLIQKKLVRKAIAMFQALEKDDAEKYKIFYETYGTNIKLGCIEDVSNKHRLSKLLRFSTNKHRDEAISLEKYVEEMKKKQKDIYYLGGESKESLIGSPYLERLARKGYDVLFLTDPIDEYVVQTLQKFDNKYKFVDVSKEGLKLDEDEEELKKFQEEYKPLTEFLKKELDTKVIEKVSVSTRLTQTPCALVSASYGYSANMERILKAQALSDKRYKQMLNQGRKTLEINPKHPIIKELLQLVKDEREDKAREAGKVLYETAVVSSGFSLEDPTAYAARVLKVLGDSLDIDPAAYEQLREELANSAAPEEEPEDETPEETTPEEPVIPEFVQENDKDEL